MTAGELVWESYRTDTTPAHPQGRVVSVEPWCAAMLMDGKREVGHVWVTFCMDAVYADFTFDDAVSGAIDAAVLPFVVEGFLGFDGHTFGFFRDDEKFRSVHLTNLRSGSEWHGDWDAIDAVVGAMKSSESYTARQIR